MKRVTFRKGWLMYQPGETAAFAADVAADLIVRGVAIDTDALVAAEAAANAAAEAEAAAKAAAEAEAAAKAAAEAEAAAKARGAKAG